MYFNNQGIIYQSYLQEISGIKFTGREIDVISCVLHGRNEKKISSLLEISQKTVATHNRNIMSKLGCNSKEYVIDFLEKSNKLQYVNQHYFDLIIEALFKRQLTKIGKEINRESLFCYIELKSATDEEKQIVEHLKQMLQVANVITIDNKNKPAAISCNLYLINEQSKNQWKDHNGPGQPNNNIFLLFDKDVNTEELGKLEYINLAAAENYYFPVFDLLKKIINKPELEKFIGEFQNEYNSLKHYSTDPTNSAAINDRMLADDKESADITTDIKLPTKHTVRKLSYPIIFIINFIIAIGSTITIWNFFLKSDNTINKETTVKIGDTPETIRNLELFLVSLKNEQFTANNVDINQANSNQNLIKKVEKILDYQNIKDVQQYFDQSTVDAATLIGYLYNLQALSSYYMYNGHDGSKAQKMLLYAKRLAENYVNSRSKVIVDFDKLTPSEVFTELYIIKGLPQIYTRLVYSLGRTYIYNNASVEGKKHFELAKFLGLRLNLFEGYLSEISGLLIIDNDIATADINTGKTSEAIAKLINIIKKYDELKNNNSTYVRDYNPAVDKQQIIIPSKNEHNIFYCESKIIELYGKLIATSNNRDRVLEYTQEINTRLNNLNYIKANDVISKGGSPETANKTSFRKIASLYITLGNILLDLNKLSIDHAEIRSTIKQRFISTDNSSSAINNLQTAEQLFEAAKSVSRNTDFTKADAYDGLVKVRQQKLISKDIVLTEEKRKELLNEIEELSLKRDAINKQLNRVNKLKL